MSPVIDGCSVHGTAKIPRPRAARSAGGWGTGCALAAAFLHPAFGYCPGCEMYLLLRRAAG
ncbi:DUF4395 family protein [Streptomyces sp. NPDC047049]|uniref:DUF4395 family protein n=1 Tax=Streptomyces sp. NPDC047049 TaxID=3156688 RepID=UPI0033C81E61